MRIGSVETATRDVYAECTVNLPKRIFVIEDNDADARIIEEALPVPGFAVTRFEDGGDALEQLLHTDSQLPDAILMDLKLSRSEGLDICGKSVTRRS